MCKFFICSSIHFNILKIVNIIFVFLLHLIASKHYSNSIPSKHWGKLLNTYSFIVEVKCFHTWFVSLNAPLDMTHSVVKRECVKLRHVHYFNCSFLNCTLLLLNCIHFCFLKVVFYCQLRNSFKLHVYITKLYSCFYAFSAGRLSISPSNATYIAKIAC